MFRFRVDKTNVDKVEISGQKHMSHQCSAPFCSGRQTGSMTINSMQQCKYEAAMVLVMLDVARAKTRPKSVQNRLNGNGGGVGQRAHASWATRPRQVSLASLKMLQSMVA